ncbi:hypothetical protein ACFP9V_06555 [Deinococcus radiopugnans]
MGCPAASSPSAGVREKTLISLKAGLRVQVLAAGSQRRTVRRLP